MDFLLTPLVVIASHESLGFTLQHRQPTHETTTTDDSRLLSLNLSKTWRAYDIRLFVGRLRVRGKPRISQN